MLSASCEGRTDYLELLFGSRPRSSCWTNPRILFRGAYRKSIWLLLLTSGVLSGHSRFNSFANYVRRTTENIPNSSAHTAINCQSRQLEAMVGDGETGHVAGHPRVYMDTPQGRVFYGHALIQR